MWGPTEHAIARLFATDLLAGKNSDGDYFDVQSGRLNYGALLTDMGPWSTGERLMAALALEIWGPRPKDPDDQFHVYHCATSLSKQNLAACLEAIATLGGLLQPEERFGVLKPE
jgi:hypothetical protein